MRMAYSTLVAGYALFSGNGLIRQFSRRHLIGCDPLARPLAGMVIDELLGGRGGEIGEAVITQHSLGIGRLPSPHREDAGCVALAPSGALGNGGDHIVPQWPD